MTCQHRWEPSNFAIKHRAPNHYMYQCQRCWKTINAILKENPCLASTSGNQSLTSQSTSAPDAACF